MNTIQNLRDTLDQHAGDVHDDAVGARTAAVRGRARIVRRRRAAGVAAAAALVVAGAGVLAVVPEREPGPAAAPQALTALGWRYEIQDTERTGDDRLTVDLPASDLPRLVSWSTSGSDQRVVVRQPGERWTSETADFGDFLQLPPGFEGEVTVQGPAGLALATYNLDPSATPDGIGDGATTFREDVAGYEFLGAAAGEPGAASVEVALTPEDSTVWLGYYCLGIPDDVEINVNWVGAKGAFIQEGGCGAGAVFDPGGSPGTGLTPGRRAGQPGTMRLWLTRDGQPVADGDYPDLRVGLGAYTADRGATALAGTELLRQIEHDGHVWELEDTVETVAGDAPRLQVPEDGTFLVTHAIRAAGRLRYGIAVDGRLLGSETVIVNGGAGSGGPTRVPAGSEASLRVRTPQEQVRAAGLALYRQVR